VREGEKYLLQTDLSTERAFRWKQQCSETFHSQQREVIQQIFQLPDETVIRVTYTDIEAFTAMKIQVEVFWVVTSCSVMVGYQRFRAEDGGGTDP
jgi:hypothetical protein